MDLQGLLKKTEQRSSKIKNTRTAPSVATDDRPYTNDLGVQTTVPINADSVSKSEINRAQTGNKQVTELGTNREQTGNRIENKSGTNREQTGNRIENNPQNPIMLSIETGNKLGAQLGTELRTNREQTENKLGTESRFLSLSGLQRGTVLFMYSLCRAAGTRETENVRLEMIASSLQTTTGAVKETIKRLIAKGFIQRLNYRAGRGGFSSYFLPENIYRQLFELETGNKLGTNREHSGNKLGAQLGTQLGTSVPSSSSILIKEEFKTTTTGEPDLCKVDPTKLPPEWEQVNCVPLADYGFGESQLSQIVRDKLLTPEMVQDSIYAFAFDLRENTKEKELRGAPLNYFMGILRKGLAYARPPNYETPQEAARRKRLELLQREESQRQAEEQQILELEFSSWKRGQSVAEIVAQLPEHARRPGPVQDSALKNYFVENVWPELQTSQSDVDPSEREKIKATIAQSFGEERG